MVKTWMTPTFFSPRENNGASEPSSIDADIAITDEFTR
jgi:hypothetical protein